MITENKVDTPLCLVCARHEGDFWLIACLLILNGWALGCQTRLGQYFQKTVCRTAQFRVGMNPGAITQVTLEHHPH